MFCYRGQTFFNQFNFQFCRSLLEFVIHEDEATSEAAASALKYTMQTSEAKEGLSKSKDLQLNGLLMPFCCTISSATFDPYVLSDSNPGSFDMDRFTR